MQSLKLFVHHLKSTKFHIKPLRQFSKIESNTTTTTASTTVNNNNKKSKDYIPPPPHPTMAESVGLKMDVEDLKKLLNPTGFLNENDFKEYQGIDKSGKLESNKNVETSTKEKSKDTTNMAPEYGFKVKGPEPTRYGDWERKGKCVDF